MSDDLNPDARRLVDLARQARTPGERDKLRLAQRLAVPLATGAALGGAAAAAKAAEVAGTGAKLASGGFLGSLGAKLAALAAIGAASTAIVVTQLGEPSSAVVAPSAQPPVPAPARTPATEAEPAPTPTPEPILVPDQLAPEASERSAPAKASPARSAGGAGELAEEAALLHQAQTAWRAGQSAQALQLANQHAQRFPRSQLGNERDVLRVLSLCKLGQTQAAKQVGARLLSKAKGSPWYQSVAQSCAGAE